MRHYLWFLNIIGISNFDQLRTGPSLSSVGAYWRKSLGQRCPLLLPLRLLDPFMRSFNFHLDLEGRSLFLAALNLLLQRPLKSMLDLPG